MNAVVEKSKDETVIVCPACSTWMADRSSDEEVAGWLKWYEAFGYATRISLTKPFWLRSPRCPATVRLSASVVDDGKTGSAARVILDTVQHHDQPNEQPRDHDRQRHTSGFRRQDVITRKQERASEEEALRHCRRIHVIESATDTAHQEPPSPEIAPLLAGERPSAQDRCRPYSPAPREVHHHGSPLPPGSPASSTRHQYNRPPLFTDDRDRDRDAHEHGRYMSHEQGDLKPMNPLPNINSTNGRAPSPKLASTSAFLSAPAQIPTLLTGISADRNDEGRRKASSHRGGNVGSGRSRASHEQDDPDFAPMDDWLGRSNNLESSSASSSAPVQRPTLLTGISATADPNTHSPYSAHSRSPVSVSPPAVSPTSNASHTPALSARPLDGTPGNLVTGLPIPSRPMQSLPGAMQNGTPMLMAHGLPTPSHYGDNLPQHSPVSPSYAYPYNNMNGYSSAQPSPVQPFSPALPMSTHHTPAQQQIMLSTHGTPAQHYASLSTPGQHPLELITGSPVDTSMLMQNHTSPLHIATDMGGTYYDLDLGGELDLDPGNAHNHTGMLGVPTGSINLTISGSPSPQPSPLADTSSADTSMLMQIDTSPSHISTDLQGIYDEFNLDGGLRLDPYDQMSSGSVHSEMHAAINDSINLTITGSPPPRP